MSQAQLVILLFRIVLIANVVAISAFIAQYTRLAPWWRNPIGRTIVIKDILLALVLIPSILSLFFHFSRLSSYVAAWVDVVLFGLIAPVMVWRIIIWERIHRDKDRGQLLPAAPAPAGEPGAASSTGSSARTSPAAASSYSRLSAARFPPGASPRS